MSEMSSSCPTTGIFCKYLEIVVLAREAALMGDLASTDYKKMLLSRKVGDVAAKLRPSEDRLCQEGYCAVVGNILGLVIADAAIERANGEILGIGQPHKRKKNKT